MGPLAKQEERYFWLFISPWVLGFLIFTVYSMGLSLYWSFTKFDFLTPAKWVGLGNYKSLFFGFHSRLFFQALKVTTIYTMVSVPLRLAGGFAIALLMNQKIKGINFFRTVYYLPAVTAGVAMSLIWYYIFTPDVGVLNWLLRFFGIKGPNWLGSTTWALPSLILMSTWGFGGPMLIYLAGLQSIPEYLYEAAEIDGAGVWAKFRHVTIPMMTPVIFYNLVISIISSFQVFTVAYVMTGGGPANATLFYVLHIYNTAFEEFRMGLGSALAWILFAVIIGFTFLQFKGARFWVYYEAGG